MKTIEFCTGDRVVTIKDGELRRGTVKTFFDELDPSIAIIEFEDGSVEKVWGENVAKEAKAETMAENEPVEKSEITITPDKFREIACRVVAEKTHKHILVGVAFAQILGDIHRALFVDPWEDEKILN